MAVRSSRKETPPTPRYLRFGISICDMTSPLRDEYENAKKRLAQQRSTLQAFSEEGQRMLRIIFVFIGLLLTAMSAYGAGRLGQVGIIERCVVVAGRCPTIGSSSVLAVLLLSSSAILHGIIGREAKAIQTIGTPEDLSDLIDNPQPGTESYHLDRLKRYRSRIANNDRVIDVLESYLALGKASLALGIALITGVGFAVALGPLSPIYVGSVCLIFILFFGYLWLRLPESYRKSDSIFGRIWMVRSDDSYSTESSEDSPKESTQSE